MKLPLKREQLSALAELRRNLPGMRFVLIGAAAIKAHIALERATADIDLALVVEPDDIEPLIAPLGWRRNPRMLQRWIHRDGALADILPATPSAIAEGSVTLASGDKSMSMVGFDLVLLHAQSVSLDSFDVSVEVASLPSLAILKIVAWLDRPQERSKDLGDLAHMLEYALSDDDPRRWDADHAVGASGLDYDDQSAFFVGHEVARIASSIHRAKLMRFLTELDHPRGHAFSQMVRAAYYADDDPDARLARRLTAFRAGLRLEHAAPR